MTQRRSSHRLTQKAHAQSKPPPQTRAQWQKQVRQVRCPSCDHPADPNNPILGSIAGKSALWASCPHCLIPLGEPWIE